MITLARRIGNSQELLKAGVDVLCEISPRDVPLQETMQRSVTEQNISKAMGRIAFKKYEIL